MKRLYYLLVIVMLLTSSFVIGLNENFVKAVNTSVSNSQVFILRTCDGRTVYYEGEEICLEIIVNNPYDTPLQFDDIDYELGVIYNSSNSTLASPLLIKSYYEINSTFIPPYTTEIFDRIYYHIDSRWINGTHIFYFTLLKYSEYSTNLILDILTSNTTNINSIIQENSANTSPSSKPADQPYGYLVCGYINGRREPCYRENAMWIFHFIGGTNDIPGDAEYNAFRNATRTWNNLRGFWFSIIEEPRPPNDNNHPCRRDGHSHVSWAPSTGPCSFNGGLAVTYRWFQAYGPSEDADIVFNDDLRWSVDGSSYYDVESVALHELGHVISLDDLYRYSYHQYDQQQVMYSYQGIRRDLRWGDIAGARWMYPARYNVESAWFGSETAEIDATIGYIDYNSRPDLIVAWIDNPSGPNRIYYKIGWNLDQDGYASRWSSIILIPDSIGDNTPGLAIALTNLDSNPRPDLFVAWLERGWWFYPDKIYYRVGWNLDIYGMASSWSSIRSIDLEYFSRNDYLGIAIYDFNRNGKLDVVFVTWGTFFDARIIKYKIGWDINPDLSFSSISSERWVTDQDQIAGLGAAVIANPDLDKNNIPEIIIAYMWDGAWPIRGPNRIEYIILWNFNTNGQYSSWERKLGPFYPYINGYGWHTQGVGVAVFDLNRATPADIPGHEFIFVWMDNPYGENKMYYVIEWESRVWSHG
jgi:hypothetical protein